MCSRCSSWTYGSQRDPTSGLDQTGITGRGALQSLMLAAAGPVFRFAGRRSASTELTKSLRRQHLLNEQDYLPGLKRFSDQVTPWRRCASVEHRIETGHQGEMGRRTMCLHPFRQLVAVHLWHHYVGQNNVERFVCAKGNRIAPAGSRLHNVTSLFKCKGKETPNWRFVVHDQNLGSRCQAQSSAHTPIRPSDATVARTRCL